jgi:hypothetical protein
MYKNRKRVAEVWTPEHEISIDTLVIPVAVIVICGATAYAWWQMNKV